MSNRQVVSLYESVAEVTNQMLAAAKQQDWDKLEELEASCQTYVEKINGYGELAPLTGDAYSSKLSCIKRILENDREIRNLMAPWMLKLNTMLNASSKQSVGAQARQV